MSTSNGVVYVLDDEPEMVTALARLLRGRDFEVRAFTSVRAFLEVFDPRDTACLVLDVTMPELGGLDLQKQLTHQGVLAPIVFLTAHGNVPMSVRAIKAGATDFLLKPVDAEALIPAVESALKIAKNRGEAIREQDALTARLATLSAREHEVMACVVAGLLNKQIAAKLGTGEQNIKLHRAHIMAKMGVASLAALVRVAERLDIGK
jgi:FixJ family two-component response regulator